MTCTLLNFEISSPLYLLHKPVSDKTLHEYNFKLSV